MKRTILLATLALAAFAGPSLGTARADTSASGRSGDCDARIAALSNDGSAAAADAAFDAIDCLRAANAGPVAGERATSPGTGLPARPSDDATDLDALARADAKLRADTLESLSGLLATLNDDGVLIPPRPRSGDPASDGATVEQRRRDMESRGMAGVAQITAPNGWDYFPSPGTW